MKSGYNRRKFLSTYELQMSQSAVRLPTGYSTSCERWFLDTSLILNEKECNMINLRYYKKNKFAVLIDADGLSGVFAKIVYDRINEIGIFSKAYLFLSRKNTRIKEWTLLANLYGFEPIMTGNLITPKRVFHKVKKKAISILKYEQEIDMIYLVIRNKDYMKYYNALENEKERLVILDINNIGLCNVDRASYGNK